MVSSHSRQLLDAWKASRSEPALRAYAKSAVAEEILSQERVDCALAMGLPSSWNEWVESMASDCSRSEQLAKAIAFLPPVEAIGYLCEVTERAKAAWSEAADARLTCALKALDSWESAEPHTLYSLGMGAGEAGSDLDYPELTIDVDPARVRAMEFAAAVADGVLGLFYLRTEDTEEFHECLGSATNFAAKAATDRAREEAWQLSRLRELLLGVSEEACQR